MSLCFISRIQSGELKDEDGVLLGGKRASIQFAHNLQNKDDSEEISDVTTSPVSDLSMVVVLQTKNVVIIILNVDTSTHEHVLKHIHIAATNSSEVGTAHNRFSLGMAPMTELIVLWSHSSLKIEMFIKMLTVISFLLFSSGISQS